MRAAVRHLAFRRRGGGDGGWPCHGAGQAGDATTDGVWKQTYAGYSMQCYGVLALLFQLVTFV